MIRVPFAKWIAAGVVGVIGVEVSAFREWISEKPERQLVRAAKAGDQQAFQQLMQMHSASLRRFLAQRVARTEIEDLLQDTWIAAWQGIGRYSGRSRFRTWLFAICLYKVRDYWRERVARTQTEEISPFESDCAYLPKEFKGAELREMLSHAWGTLSQDQREVLDLYYFGDLTLAEVGKVLGRNVNTVKYQFYRAQEKLADVLAPEVDN